MKRLLWAPADCRNVEAVRNVEPNTGNICNLGELPIHNVYVHTFICRFIGLFTTAQTTQKTYFEHQCRRFSRRNHVHQARKQRQSQVGHWGHLLRWKDWAKMPKIITINAPNVFWSHDFSQCQWALHIKNIWQNWKQGMESLLGQRAVSVLGQLAGFGTIDDATEPWSSWCGTQGMRKICCEFHEDSDISDASDIEFLISYVDILCPQRRSQEQELGQAFSSQTGQAWHGLTPLWSLRIVSSAKGVVSERLSMSHLLLNTNRTVNSKKSRNPNPASIC